jgi:hypothetical protein
LINRGGFVNIGKLFCLALGGIVISLALSDIFAAANFRVVKVSGFDEFEVHGKHSHTHRRALTDLGPLRFPSDYEWGFYDNRVVMRNQLKAGCRYQVMVSHEPKEHKASLGNYNFIFRGNRELDVGRIDKVVSLVDCLG